MTLILPQIGGLTFAPADTGWDLSRASYDGVSLSVSAQDSSMYDLKFKTDGTKMYTVGLANDRVYEYDLSIPWDVSSASFAQSISVSAQDPQPISLEMADNGTRMFIGGFSSDRVYSYSLSTAWDISTATLLTSFSTAAQDVAMYSATLSGDGFNMYTLGSSDRVFEYTLSTAWDISTALFTQSFNVRPQDSTPWSINFKDDGTEMFILGTSTDTFYQYSLSNAWDISTASLTQSFDVSGETTFPAGSAFRPDGLGYFIITPSTIYQYSIA